MFVILTQSFPSRLGGIESLVSNLAINISKMGKVLVFADSHHLFFDAIFDKKYEKKILVRRYGGLKFFRRRKKVKELKVLINNSEVNFVIADTWKSLELCIDDLNQKNIKVICLAHGNELYSDNENKKKRIFNTLSKANIIVANSKFTYGLLDKILNDNRNIKVVYPGAVDLRNIKPDPFINFEGGPILLTLSRLEKRKGHALVLEVIKKLKKDFKNIRYIIAGHGKEKKNLMNLVLKHNIQENVIFAGNVTERKKNFLFSNTDLMVMPTIDESHARSIEGFGISYLEAAFFGVPSVASNIGGSKEAVLNNETGLVIDNPDQLFEAINSLLKDEKKLKLLGENAKKRAESEFVWKKVVQNYILTTE